MKTLKAHKVAEMAAKVVYEISKWDQERLLYDPVTDEFSCFPRKDGNLIKLTHAIKPISEIEQAIQDFVRNPEFAAAILEELKLMRRMEIR